MPKLIHRQVNKDGTITVAFCLEDKNMSKRVCVISKSNNCPIVIALGYVVKDKLSKLLNALMESK